MTNESSQLGFGPISIAFYDPWKQTPKKNLQYRVMTQKVSMHLWQYINVTIDYRKL